MGDVARGRGKTLPSAYPVLLHRSVQQPGIDQDQPEDTNMTNRVYFIMAARLSATSPWGVAFGSYVRSECDDERQDLRDHGERASNIRIIRLGDTNAEIDAAIAQLNREIVHVA